MKIHKYFFWIEDDSIETYKDGKIQKYKGEKKFSISNGIKIFWEIWKENSAFISDDLTYFIFLGKDNVEIKKIKKYCEDLKKSEEEIFTFEDLKKILNNKKIGKFVLNLGDEELFFIKTEYGYNKIPREDNLEKIYIVGDNITKNSFLTEEIYSQNEENNSDDQNKKQSKLVSFFENKMNNYKKQTAE